MTEINVGEGEAIRQKITENFTINQDGKIIQEVPKKNLEARKNMIQKKIDRLDAQIASLQKEKDAAIEDIAELDTFIVSVNTAIAAKEPK